MTLLLWVLNGIALALASSSLYVNLRLVRYWRGMYERERFRRFANGK